MVPRDFVPVLMTFVLVGGFAYFALALTQIDLRRRQPPTLLGEVLPGGGAVRPVRPRSGVHVSLGGQLPSAWGFRTGDDGDFPHPCLRRSVV